MCGLNLSKVRFEIFLNRIGLDVIRGQKQYRSMTLCWSTKNEVNTKIDEFLFKKPCAFRHYSGSRYNTISFAKRHMARSQMRKDLLEKYRLSGEKHCLLRTLP